MLVVCISVDVHEFCTSPRVESMLLALSQKNIVDDEKECATCGRCYALKFFKKQKTGVGGHSHQCRDCVTQINSAANAS